MIKIILYYKYNSINLSQEKINDMFNCLSKSNKNFCVTDLMQYKKMGGFFKDLLDNFYSVKDILSYYEYCIGKNGLRENLEDGDELISIIARRGYNASSNISDFVTFMGQNESKSLVKMMSYKNKENKNIFNVFLDKRLDVVNILNILNPLLVSKESIDKVKSLFMEAYSVDIRGADKKVAKFSNLLSGVVAKAVDSQKYNDFYAEVWRTNRTDNNIANDAPANNTEFWAEQKIGNLLSIMKDKFNFSEQDMSNMLPNGTTIDFNNKTIEVAGNGVFSDDIVINF